MKDLGYRSLDFGHFGLVEAYLYLRDSRGSAKISTMKKRLKGKSVFCKADNTGGGGGKGRRTRDRGRSRFNGFGTRGL